MYVMYGMYTMVCIRLAASALMTSLMLFHLPEQVTTAGPGAKPGLPPLSGYLGFLWWIWATSPAEHARGKLAVEDMPISPGLFHQRA